MPNIVITEGLDTPWELKNTETNITAATDLGSINLANQTVGKLAFTASQLFGSLKTEKDNLDKIVDAIELINEEIALFPERIAAWDSIQKLNLPDSVVGVIPTPVPLQKISTGSFSDNNLLNSTPLNFLGLNNSGLEEERNYLNTIMQLSSVKPLLESTGLPLNQGLAYQLQTSFGDIRFTEGSWFTTNRIKEASSNETIDANDMVVYRDAAGQPVNYRLYDGTSTNLRTWTDIPPSRVIPFAVPLDAADLNRWREAVEELGQLNATKAISSTVGLPEGVTPPVTTLGVTTEKFSVKARYTTVAATLGANGTLTPIDGPLSAYMGAYPPPSPPNMNLSNLTKNDIGKLFKEPGTDRTIYVEGENNAGNLIFRVATKTEPFINNMTDDIKKTLRGEYAEKQILLTQRSTDQTLFVTSITQRYTTFSDMATNLLKTLMNFYNDLARNLRG